MTKLVFTDSEWCWRFWWEQKYPYWLHEVWFQKISKSLSAYHIQLLGLNSVYLSVLRQLGRNTSVPFRCYKSWIHVVNYIRE